MAKTRRQKGLGTVKSLGNGAFFLRWTVGKKSNGKPDQRSKKLEKTTKTEAEKYLIDELAKVNRGEVVKKTGVTLEEHIKDWLDSKRAEIRVKTHKEYTKTLNTYIVPTLGNLKLTDLEPQDIQRVYSQMLGKGLSPRTVRLTNTNLSQSLDRAVEWKMLVANPCKLVKLPKDNVHGEAKEIDYWEDEDLRKFLAAASKHDYSLLFHTLVYTGIRFGEAIGLRWSDIDFKNRQLSVRRSVKLVDKELVINPPKTPKSRRSIKLPLVLTEMLLEAKGKSNQWVFEHKDGKPITYDGARSVFLRLQDKAEVERTISIHGVRHTHATWLLIQKIHPKVVQERLGHSSIAMTLDTYSHLIPGLQQEAADVLEGLAA